MVTAARRQRLTGTVRWNAGAVRPFRAGLTSRLRVALASILLASLASTSTGASTEAVRIPADEILAGTSLGITKDSPQPVADERQVLALSEEMRQFIATHVDRNASDELKLHQLVSAIIDSATFGVEYDDITRTASETFRMRRGNCLSFSNLFVALARDVGLRAEFQEVEIPPDWTIDKDTYVLNQHMDVWVNLGRAGTRVVDFNISDFKTSYEMRRISDGLALAHYFNNVGVERMQQGDSVAALTYFRKAIEESDRKFSPAWTNLGTLYLRHGDRAHAEAAYLIALRCSRADLVAMSNLVRLYELAGDHQRAAAYQKRVFHHRWLNPYYRYELARQAYASHKYDEAIAHLKYAVRERPKEDQFYSLLGLSYLGKGDARAAQRAIARAREIAASDALKRKYSRKIDILLNGGGKNQ